MLSVKIRALTGKEWDPVVWDGDVCKDHIEAENFEHSDILLLFLVFQDMVFLCNSPGCPGTHFVEQAGLKLRDLPASASRVLGLKPCNTMPGMHQTFESLPCPLCVPTPLLLLQCGNDSQVF